MNEGRPLAVNEQTAVVAKILMSALYSHPTNQVVSQSSEAALIDQAVLAL